MSENHIYEISWKENLTLKQIFSLIKKSKKLIEIYFI